VRYESFELVLIEPREVGDSLELRVQVLAAAGMQPIIEPIASWCDLAIVRRLSDAEPGRAPDTVALLEAGLALGRALAPGLAETRLREALALVRSHGQGLRIRIVGGDAVHAVP
jgi:hypothetical protein